MSSHRYTSNRKVATSESLIGTVQELKLSYLEMSQNLRGEPKANTIIATHQYFKMMILKANFDITFICHVECSVITNLVSRISRVLQQVKIEKKVCNPLTNYMLKLDIPY